MDDNNHHKNQMNIVYNENAYNHLSLIDNENDNLDILNKNFNVKLIIINKKETNRFQILPNVYSIIVQHNQDYDLFPIEQIVHKIDLNVVVSIVFYMIDKMYDDNPDKLLSMLLDLVQ